MSSSSNAFYYFQQGWKLIQHKAVRGFIVWPLAINTFLFISISTYAYGEMAYWIELWVSSLPSWLAFLASIIKLLAIIFLLFIAMFSFAILNTLISAPFYCLVAEQVATVLQHPVPDTPMTLHALCQLGGRSIHREIQKMMYYVPRTLILIVISFIPGIHVISPILWSIWGAWMLSIQFIDYAADNDMISATRVRHLLSQEKINALLFGGLIMIGMLIPVVNIVMGVVAVAAATVYWIDLQKSITQEPS